ncbi:MAG: DUF922 domain-containing protein [Rhizobiaceae bacterium]|nr:MAG: DUF922 domain-containing protein [Rhizobiaceae bacterium]CAG1004127.1 hypothetical protein RHIZO_03064 [Rhizobiaceae bacterium]
MSKRILLTAALSFLALAPAVAAGLTKSYSYFTIGGVTVEEIERELNLRGPQVRSTGNRHPGATRMEFKSRVKYGMKKDRCAVVDARVTVEARIILPRWSKRSKADDDVRLIWDTLSADIKRHEESHVVIAKNHARELENALRAISPQRDCAAAEAKVAAATDAVLARHDEEQQRFDRIEGINFESRLLRLLRYRMERIEAGTLAQ